MGKARLELVIYAGFVLAVYLLYKQHLERSRELMEQYNRKTEDMLLDLFNKANQPQEDKQ